MVRRKPSMEDVAEKAGVSRITVDRVLNGRGGVKPQTEQLVIATAKALGVDRALNMMPTRILRIGVVLQNNTNSYYVKLREGFTRTAQQYKRYNIRVSFWYFEQITPEAAIKTLNKAAADCDALVVILFDDPQVVMKTEELARKMPIVTVASDLPATGRVDYVGSNALQEGRTAGALMGRFLGPPGGEIVIIVGFHQLLEHDQREVGFRNILRRNYPNCQIVETFQSFEQEDIRKDFRALLKTYPNLKGIYNMSVGNPGLAEELKAVGKDQTTCIITHTVTPERVALMNEGVVDAIIDRDPYLDARRAIEIQLCQAGRFSEEEVSAAQRPQIFIRENVRFE
ncbi:LacI family DNA-binding transcriptional regulator [Sinorhizobium sp. BG8]|uniref:LacI family DNA-binding transcriptional regulator n=1 Tax=Sinorhizobium sp. BG8 TaxID=2613773 RepID=UPI00193E98DD|nr:LacI family DNA-binding transcriptional regulator [Sinorhizobium sp. BG8]QRM55858.1 LacI family transcriptional regulator [Sinorhizobium sp. BG8]